MCIRDSYLPLATLEAALGGLAASAAPGSVLVTDYYARGFLDHPWGKAVADYAAQRGEPMSADSALDPATAADFYARCGWRVTADLDASGIREKILVPRRRSHEPIVPFVHFVSAERAEVGR